MKTLRSLRLAAGLSQRDAGALCGCTQAFVSFAELGQRVMRPDREARLRAALEARLRRQAADELARELGRSVVLTVVSKGDS